MLPNDLALLAAWTAVAATPLTLAQGGAPLLSGTDEGLGLLVGVDGSPPDTADVQLAAAGDSVQLVVTSDDPALDGSVLLLGFGVVPPGAVPSPSLPGLALDLTEPFGSFGLGLLDGKVPAELQLELPSQLVGLSLVLQAIAVPVGMPTAASNGLFAASDGRRLDVTEPSSPTVVQEDLRLMAADTSAGDNFGFDVWIDGDRIAVGAPFDDVITPDTGSAYLFDAATGAELRKFSAPLGFFGDDLGTAVALRGPLLLCGAPGADFTSLISGRIYVFDVSTGQLVQNIAPVGGGVAATVGHALGECIDFSSAFMVSGSRGDTAITPGGGSAHVFDAATGVFLRKLFPEDPGFADNFGSSVAASGSLVLVGSPFDDVAAPDSGSAYLFDGSTGQQLHKFAPLDAGPDDLVGFFVALDGDLVLLGAPFLNGDDGTVNAGAVYVYDAVSGNLVDRLESPQPQQDSRFGDGLAIGGDVVLVGESQGANASGVRAGVIHVYDRATLAPLYRLETSDGLDGDALGESISIDGDRVVAGARGVDAAGDLAGAVYLFTLPGAR